MKKTIMGILSFAPIVLFIVTMVLMVSGIITTETVSEDAALGTMMLAVFFAFAFAIVGWVDIIWFIILVCRKKHWATNKKVIWSLLIYFLNVFVFPAFWWIGIVKDDQ